MIGLITGLATTVGSLFKNWQEKKKIVAAGKVEVAKAKVDGDIKRAQSQQDADNVYDLAANKGMKDSWKDEYWTIVLSIPAVLCFVPGLADVVRDGFKVLSECPVWYQSCLVGAIAASFGIKGFLKLKEKGGK